MTDPWYKNGICFTCKQCGNCCSGSPGYVFLSEKDMEEIAKFLKFTVEEVKKKYCRFAKNKWALLEKANYDCIFLQDRKCRIYPARPIQCKTYPFWPDLLQSKEHFESISSYCKGLNNPKDVFSYEEIQEKLKEYLEHYNKE